MWKDKGPKTDLKGIASYLLVLPIVCFSCSETNKPQPLNIAIASNMQYALEEVTQKFTEQTGFRTHMIIGSSGKLSSQINQGAPYDLFLSADLKFPEQVNASGKAYGPIHHMGQGQLAVWYKNVELNSFEGLANLTADKMAIANPDTAPYGRSSKEALQKLGIWEGLKSKLVFGESIGQVNQFISTGAVSVAITSYSTIKAGVLPSEGKFILIDPNWHQPIDQYYVAIANGPKPHKALKPFMDFLETDHAKVIFAKFGYLITLQ